MNPIDDDQMPVIDQHLLDLLADGELDASRQRELLARLDDTPDGWRRCALSLLEAQSFRSEFCDLLHHRPSAARASGPAASRVSRGVSWKTLLAMAAGFLVALGLGLHWGDFLGRSGRPDPAPLVVAQSEPNVPSPGIEAGQLAVARTEAADVPPDEQPIGENRAPERSAAATLSAETGPTAEAGAWQLVSFPLGDGFSLDDGSDPSGESIQLPAIERDQIDDAWLESLPPAMSPDVLRSIENLGHRVRQIRRLLPVRMSDGRRLVIPVDQVELQFVGNRSYQ